MTQLTNQEIFDRVAAHLITQGKQAMDEGSCAYRGANDTSCAVGCLIPDDLYLSSMENRTFTQLVRNYPRLEEVFSPESYPLLRELQSLHDNTDPHAQGMCVVLRDVNDKRMDIFDQPKLKSELRKLGVWAKLTIPAVLV
jgi:hypothetical protein